MSVPEARVIVALETAIRNLEELTRQLEEEREAVSSLRALLKEARPCLDAWDDRYPIGLRARIDAALGGPPR